MCGCDNECHSECVGVVSDCHRECVSVYVSAFVRMLASVVMCSEWAC